MRSNSPGRERSPIRRNNVSQNKSNLQQSATESRLVGNRSIVKEDSDESKESAKNEALSEDKIIETSSEESINGQN